MPKQLRTEQLCITTPEGRVLVRDLTMRMPLDKVAIIGRNGVGKSTLLATLAGAREPTSGERKCSASTAFVPQQLVHDERSGGERRRDALDRAFAQNPELLLLDEPSEDLCTGAMAWLVARVRQWPSGLLLVSHNPELLAEFRHFFIMTESGCHYRPGSFEQVNAERLRADESQLLAYDRRMRTLEREELRNDRIRRRRRRKQNGGRVRELGRAPSRAMLNSKRSYAQESQGKREVLQNQRIEAARSLVLAQREALTTTLQLSAVMPTLPKAASEVIRLCGVGKLVGGQALFQNLEVSLSRQRLAITGPNGSGKTSLLDIMVGARSLSVGHARLETAAIGAIDQGAFRWMVRESLLEKLLAESHLQTAEDVAQRLLAHRFPIGLAERSLHSLSPGERLRAALICLCERRPTVEMLVLDEPTWSLDAVGTSALTSVLRAWPGGLIVASHNRAFLDAVGFGRELRLGDAGTTMAQITPGTSRSPWQRS